MQTSTTTEHRDVWRRHTFWSVSALATLGAMALASWRVAQLRHQPHRHTQAVQPAKAVTSPHAIVSICNNDTEAAVTSEQLTESDPGTNSTGGSSSSSGEDSSTQRLRRIAHIAQPVHEYEKKGLPGGAHGWRRVYGLLQASMRSVSEDLDAISGGHSSSSNNGSSNVSEIRQKIGKSASEGSYMARPSSQQMYGRRRLVPDVSSLQPVVMTETEDSVTEKAALGGWRVRLYDVLAHPLTILTQLSRRALAHHIITQDTSEVGQGTRRRGSAGKPRSSRRTTNEMRHLGERTRSDTRRTSKSAAPITDAAASSQGPHLTSSIPPPPVPQQQERTLQDQISYLVHATHLARQEMEAETLALPPGCQAPDAEPYTNREGGVLCAAGSSSNRQQQQQQQQPASGALAATTTTNTATALPLYDYSAGCACNAELPMPPCTVARMLLTVPPSPVLTATDLKQKQQKQQQQQQQTVAAAAHSSLTAASAAGGSSLSPAQPAPGVQDTSHKLTISQLWQLLETRRQLQMAHTRALQAGLGDGRDPAQLVQRYREHRGEHNAYGQVLSDLTTEMRYRRVPSRARANAALTDNNASVRRVVLQQNTSVDNNHNNKRNKARKDRHGDDKPRSSEKERKVNDVDEEEAEEAEDDDRSGEYGDVDEDRAEYNDTEDEEGGGEDMRNVVAMLRPRWSAAGQGSEDSSYHTHAGTNQWRKRNKKEEKEEDDERRPRTGSAAADLTHTSLRSRTSTNIPIHTAARSNKSGGAVVSATTMATPLPTVTHSAHGSTGSAPHSSLITTTTTTSFASSSPSSCTSGASNGGNSSMATSHVSSYTSASQQQQQQQQQQRMQERRRDDLTVKNYDGGAYYSLSVTYHDSLTGASRTVDAKSLPPLAGEGQAAASSSSASSSPLPPTLPFHAVSARRVNSELIRATSRHVSEVVAVPATVVPAPVPPPSSSSSSPQSGPHRSVRMSDAMTSATSQTSPSAAGLMTGHTTTMRTHSPEAHNHHQHHNNHNNEEDEQEEEEEDDANGAVVQADKADHNVPAQAIDIDNDNAHATALSTSTATSHTLHEPTPLSVLTATQALTSTTNMNMSMQGTTTTTTAASNSNSPKVAVFAAPLPAYEPMDGPQLQGVAGRRGEMRIGAFLGGGACGKVYECLNTETGQILAAKQIVFDAKDAKLRQRLKQLELELEVLTLAARHHAPWIVGFHGAEKRGHSVLMYLEYCAHSSLLDFMAEGNGSEAARWGMASSVPLAPHPSMQSYSLGGANGASLCHMLCTGMEYPSKERTTPPILPIVCDKAEGRGGEDTRDGIAVRQPEEGRINEDDEEGEQEDTACDLNAEGRTHLPRRTHRHRHAQERKRLQLLQHCSTRPHIATAAEGEEEEEETYNNGRAAVAAGATAASGADTEAAAAAAHVLQPMAAPTLQSHVECVELQFSPVSSHGAHPSLSRASSSMSFTAQCSFTSSTLTTTTTTTTTTSCTHTHNTSSNSGSSENTSNSSSEASASVHSVALTMTLSEAMHPQVPPLSIAQVQRFTRQTVEGLHFLHTSGYAHLDVKTANILITADEECRLADLGCAMRLKPSSGNIAEPGTSYRLLQEHESITELRGTALYMAPEMIRFERTRIGSAADIWSLGCVVMEIATGCAPWRHVAKDKLHVLFRVGSARHELPLPPLLQAWMEEAKEWLAQWGDEAPQHEQENEQEQQEQEEEESSEAACDAEGMSTHKSKKLGRRREGEEGGEGEGAGRCVSGRGGTEKAALPPRQRTRLEGERWGLSAARTACGEEHGAGAAGGGTGENGTAYMAQQRRLMQMYIELVDFVHCCLRIRPEARSTTTQLLQHPFLNL